MKIKPWAAAMIVALIVVIAVVISRSLSSDIDTSGFKPGPKITAQDIDKQVQEIQNNPKIPEASKPMIIGQIRSRLGPQNHR